MLKVGDKVKLTTIDLPWPRNTTGTIVFVDKDNMYAFESDTNTEGHHCNSGGDGQTKTEHGWWVGDNEVKLIE